MKVLEAAVNALLIVVLIDYVRDSRMLDAFSPATKTAAFAGILFVAFMTLNAIWAAAASARQRRLGSESSGVRLRGQ